MPLSQGTELGKNIFWSDTYSDLRTEHYITYAPNENVTPTVAYGSKVLTRATLTSMAQGLESQGRRVVSGINGDFYVLATGAPVGLLVTDGVLQFHPALQRLLGHRLPAPTAPPLSAPQRERGRRVGRAGLLRQPRREQGAQPSAPDGAAG